jgi:hypothetical protein
VGNRRVIIDKATHIEVVQNLSEKLRTCYVFPQVAEQICTRLREHLGDGEYTDLTDGESFALMLTLQMQDVTQDEHLWVKWHLNPLPDEEAMRQSPAWADDQLQRAALDNYGLQKVERLPGNVGYIDIRYFHRACWGGNTATAAMSFLADASVLIVDLRKCLGGYPDMVALIGSYLFGEEPVHLNSIYWRDDDITQQYWTLPHVPGKRFGDNKPVYVLVSRATFSGGEEFAYDLQARQRATIIGEKTDGGAHPGASYRLHPHFEAFIPVGRAVNPITGTNWERSGVVPDISVSQEQAPKTAYCLALKSVIAGIGEPASGPSNSLLKEAQAALEGMESTCRLV